MTGQQIQEALDALVVDLQTRGKGQTIQMAIRDEDNNLSVQSLSSDAGGAVNAAQLATLQSFVDGFAPVADAYETARAPIAGLNETFKTAQAPHEPLMTAAANARKALNDALEADAVYQAAKTALETARANPVYVAAVSAYDNSNVVEFVQALRSAKGEYSV